MGEVGHLRLRMLAVCDKTNLPFKDLDNLWVNLEKKKSVIGFFKLK